MQSADPAVLARDDFNGTLSLQWDVRREDPSHVSLTKRPGFLTITTQYGDLIDSRNSAQNLYLTPAPQPFTNIQLTTCLDRFQPQANWNQAGLLCLTDVDNYVKFTVENNPPGGRRLVMIGESDGRPDIKSATDPFPTAEKLWLRITTKKSVYQFTVRADGNKFQLCGSQPWGRGNRLESPRWVGLMAINGPDRAAPDIDACFDFFDLRRTKRSPQELLLDETLAHLRLYPRDAYSQYLALQLARREGRLEEVASEVQRNNPQRDWRRRRRMGRPDQVDLFSIFSGQLAVQESLQLDAMAPEVSAQEPVIVNRRVGPPPVNGPGAGRVQIAEDVAVATLVGPTIQSHPWKQMLEGRSPQVTGLAHSVPSDFYFVSFRSVNSLLKTSEIASLWGNHVFNQATREARTQLVGERLQKQLAIEANLALQPFYDSVVGEVAVVGSDLFLREGSDVTMLFQLRQPLVFRMKMAEDGFIYLSDPFVRRLMSPEVRLTERRRLVCYNQLRMIGHAALMHQQLTGQVATSLTDLESADCIPGKFGQGKFACPEQGEYTLAADGITGVCSQHGYPSYLTPCSEIEATFVTRAEAAAYRQFVAEYSGFWQQFFDPIAIRLQITAERLRAETIVLPLINNSIYNRLARTIGGKPEALDQLPVPKRTIFSFAVRLNKAELLSQIGLEGLLEEDEVEAPVRRSSEESQQTINSLWNLAVALHNFESRAGQFPQAALVDRDGQSLLSWRVQLLPYLDQQELYNQFRLDEPWDSEHNRKLIPRMPRVFRPANQQLATAGKTHFVAPRGAATVFPTDNKKIGFAHIRDGTSNTILFLEADDEHAVIWTKPDDLEIDSSQPLRGLAVRSNDTFLVVCCDATVHRVIRQIEQPTMAAMLTRAGGEVIDRQQLVSISVGRPERSTGSIRRPPPAFVNQLKLGELLVDGVGNQIGLHVYDAEPMFDLNLARFLGMTLGSSRGGMIDDDFLLLYPLVSALNGPIYVSIPVKNPDVVDGFLGRLDAYLAQLASRIPRGGFFRVDQDFYRLSDADACSIRAYGIELGPLKWRFFWSRIRDVLYIASKVEVLADLMRMETGGSPLDTSGEDVAQALVRLRPQNWNQVVDTYRLGWEENRREACLQNVGPLSSLSRALAAGRSHSPAVSGSELEQYAARVFDAHHFCPDEGRYDLSADSRAVSCSVHGTMQQPRQMVAPAASSTRGWQLSQLRDLSLRFMFLEDGLRAIMTIERKPED